MQARASKRDFTEFDTSVKWTRSVKKSLLAGKRISFHPEHIIRALYRPFVIRQLYFDTHLNEMQNLMRDYFGDKGIAEKPAILFTDPTGQKPFMVIASSLLPDAHTVGAAAGAIVLPSRVGPTAGSAENITDWALAQFQSQYDAAGAGSNGPSPRTPYSTTSTPSCTIPLTARPTPRTSSASSRASRSMTTSRAGLIGARH